MSNSSKRVSKAEVELNKAYQRLLKNADATKLLMETLATTSEIEEILTKFKNNETWTEAERKKWGKIFGRGSIGFNLLKNSNSGYDGLTVLSEAGVDIGAYLTEKKISDEIADLTRKKMLSKLALKFIPVVGWISTGMDIFNLVNQAAGNDEISISKFIKDKIEALRGTTTDLPDLEMLKKGILKITMHDGTVYERPLVDIAGNYLLTGESKDDVLFGSNGNDILIGHGGSDILIGGSGKDDYFVGNGDIIKDSDGAGRVFLGSSHQLKGGTQIEKGSKIYKGKDGNTYELLDNGDLLINGNITIENFSNDNLEIHLSEFDEINVTISDNQAVEKAESMKFTISLSRDLKENEFVKVSVNGKEYVFMHPSNPNYVVGTKTEYVFGSEAEYEYTWKDDDLKEEDEKFEVSATATGSDGLKVSVIKTGQGVIKDDDKDNDPDPEREISPIVIDLGNDGINSHALNYTINFDLDNNGFKEATGWVSGDDALLAIDKNNNGIIDNGSELFGNKSISDSAFSYTNSSLNNGFETLKAYDTNNDNIIDNKDAEFDKLLLWQDKNGNAITDNGELIKISDKVSSIDLNYTNTDINNNSNTIRQTSTATLNNGTKVKADDIWFKVNYKDTEEIIDENQIPFEIKALPQITAFGNLKEFANLNLLVA